MNTHELARLLLADEPYELVGDFCEPPLGWGTLPEIIRQNQEERKAAQEQNKPNED